MQNKNIIGIKRTSTQISTNNDIILTDDIYLDFCRKIFINHFSKQYQKMDLSLYQTSPQKHPLCNNLIVSPHFIRDDGVIIYLQLVQNEKYLKYCQEDLVHVSMEIFETNDAVVYTINLPLDININDIHTNKDYISHSNITISEKKLKYNSGVSKKYISSFQTNKKNKITNNNNNNTNPIPEIKKFVRNEWVSASKTRNYALNDTLVDWLDYWYDYLFEKENNINRDLKILQYSHKNKSTEHDFIKFIMNKGIQFEEFVIKLIKQKVNEYEFVTICENINNNDNIIEYENKTIIEIMKGTPIIYQAVLMNWSGELAYSYGLPDLLVRSDYLCKLMDLDPMEKQMKNFPAPNLKNNYHYVVVDIKFTTLKLCNDGKRIRNSGSIPAYKSQLYVYNHALGKIQGYEPSESYILGRKYKYESLGKTYSGNSCFARFGHIQYDKWDKNYVTESISAIKWIKTLRTKGKEWELLPKPSVPELYPNMSSISDTKWNGFKMDYANKIGEITLLWNCGTKNRKIAHKNGIYNIHDPKCCSKKLGIYGKNQSQILDDIITINKKEIFKTNMDRILMKINKKINNLWMKQSKLQISIDFETINCVFDNFANLPHAQENKYLFMIGIAYKSNNNPTEYKMFLISELSRDAEFQMIYQFYHFLRNITDQYVGKNEPIPSLYHWGHIERSFFVKLCEELEKNIGSDIEKDIFLMRIKLIWYDLLDCFKKNPITINGCFKFGLKEIVGRLFELGLIQTSWKNNSECVNGNTAMVMAQKAYQTSKQTGICITESPIIREIMEYNKIDCIVIHDIIDLIWKKAIIDGHIIEK